jgi:hypothetical protein
MHTFRVAVHAFGAAEQLYKGVSQWQFVVAARVLRQQIVHCLMLLQDVL